MAAMLRRSASVGPHPERHARRGTDSERDERGARYAGQRTGCRGGGGNQHQTRLAQSQRLRTSRAQTRRARTSWARISRARTKPARTRLGRTRLGRTRLACTSRLACIRLVRAKAARSRPPKRSPRCSPPPPHLAAAGCDTPVQGATADGRPVLVCACHTRVGATTELVLWRSAGARVWDLDDRLLAGAATLVVRFVLEQDAVQREIGPAGRARAADRPVQSPGVSG